MIIKTLAENTSISDDFKSEHGLSLYIETKSHKLLFDLGMSNLFLENAKKLNADISEIDTVIISHGHYDHGGGLNAFLKVNQKAKIYINEKAFEKHYSLRANGEKAYIGLDEALKYNNRFIFVDNYLKIDDELELFSNVQGSILPSLSNKVLFMEKQGQIVEDDFVHEQNLVISEKGKTVLLAGCAHKGIANIINHINHIKQINPNYIIGGFHLYNHRLNQSEDSLLVKKLGEFLLNTGAKCYTCHCTGIEPYKKLKDIMKNNIDYLSTGSKITI